MIGDKEEDKNRGKKGVRDLMPARHLPFSRGGRESNKIRSQTAEWAVRRGASDAIPLFLIEDEDEEEDEIKE